MAKAPSSNTPHAETNPDFDPDFDPDLHRLDRLSALLDNKFSVGGIRFGLDPVIGLLPYAGDIAGLSVTAVLLRTVYRKGAGLGILLKMLWNLVIDAAAGIFPLVGDVLDVAHKANRRNVKLLQDYYADPAPKPPAGIAVTVLCFLFLGILTGIVWVSRLCIVWVWHRIFSRGA